MKLNAEAKRLRARVLGAATHYEVLGVAPGADTPAVKSAHRLLAGLFHPDRYRADDAHDIMAKVNQAYACLSDKDARRMYDAVHRTREDVCPRCEGSGMWFQQKGFKKKVQVTCPDCKGEGVL